MDTITKAGADQATAIEQINPAITPVNDVTQQNARSAEQRAAAGEELSSQATSVPPVVRDLATMVSGDKR